MSNKYRYCYCYYHCLTKFWGYIIKYEQNCSNCALQGSIRILWIPLLMNWIANYQYFFLPIFCTIVRSHVCKWIFKTAAYASGQVKLYTYNIGVCSIRINGTVQWIGGATLEQETNWKRGQIIIQVYTYSGLIALQILTCITWTYCWFWVVFFAIKFLPLPVQEQWPNFDSS